MKYLLLQNHSLQRLFFVFCTISTCRCGACDEWLCFERTPFADRPGWTFGYIQVEGYASRVDRFCPKWDCVGA